MTLQQQPNMPTIHLLPQLPPLKHQQTFINHSEQPQICNSSLHLQPTLDNMLPQLVYTSKYHQPTIDTFVTHNPSYPPTAYQAHLLSPAQTPPRHSQEQLPSAQSTRHSIKPMHNHYSFFASLCRRTSLNNLLPTYSTTIPTAIARRAIDPSHQLIANNANCPISPPVPQPTMIGPPIPPHPSTPSLYMNEFPRQQIIQTNFRHTANTVLQRFDTPTMPISQTVFTTQAQQVTIKPTDNSPATLIEPTKTEITHNRSSLRPPHTSIADANDSPACIEFPPIQNPKFNGDPLTLTIGSMSSTPQFTLIILSNEHTASATS